MPSSVQPPRRVRVHADRGRHRRESARTVLQRLQAVPVQLFPPHVFTTRMLGDAAVEGSDGARVFPAVTSYPDAFTTVNTEGARGCTAASGSATELGGSAICVLATATMTSTTQGGSLHDASLASSAVAAPDVQHRFAYEVAAAHALRGGRVAYVAAPASACFSLARFAVTVERQWVALHEQALVQLRTGADVTAAPAAGARGSASTRSPPPLHRVEPCDGPEAELRARQCAVLAAVRRVEVLSCGSVADVFAVCQAYTFPGPDDTNDDVRGANLEGKTATSTSEQGGEAVVDVVPLCILDGVTGPASSSTLLERATGTSLPLPHHLLCVLQRRLRCALLVLEDGTSRGADRKLAASSTRCWAPSSLPPQTAAVTSRYGYDALASELRRQWSGAAGGDTWLGVVLPSPESVLGASDFVQRLQTPHVHVTTSRHNGQDEAPTEEDHRRRHSAEVGRTSGSKVARVEVAAEGRDAAAVAAPSPISLHDVQLSLLYLECVEEPRVLGRGVGEGTVAAVVDRTHAECPPASPEDALLLPHAVAWRYRAHLMRATPSDSGFGGVGEDALRRPTSNSSVAAGNGSGNGGSAWMHSRSSSVRLHYSGTWVCGSQWRYL